MPSPTNNPPSRVTQRNPGLPNESSQKLSPSVQANSDPHPLLSITPYNVKLHPHVAIPTVYETIGKHPMRPNAPNRIRLVSEAFPWPIEIQRRQPVTCGDVWKELYYQVHQPITDDDWTYINHDDSMRQAVRKAYEKRVEPEDRPEEPLRRIDYLGNSTFFIGLEKDDAFVHNTLMPGAKKVQETWVARFAKSI